MSTDEQGPWGNLSAADQAALDQHRARMRDLRTGRRSAHAPYGAVVHHLDGNPWNNAPENLRIVDPTENAGGEP